MLMSIVPYLVTRLSMKYLAATIIIAVCRGPSTWHRMVDVLQLRTLFDTRIEVNMVTA